MPVAFDTIPSNAGVPLFWPEIRPAQAPFTSTLRMLLIGRSEELSTGPTEEAIIISDQIQADLWGPGSMISHMFETARLNGGPWIEIHAIALPKDASFVAATATIKVTAPPARDGVYSLLIGGRGLSVVGRKGQTAADVALNIKKAINTQPRFAFKAAIDGTNAGWVILTCKWKGGSGNDIIIVQDYYGRGPSSLSVTVIQPAGGVGEPSIANVFANIHGRTFDVMVPAGYAGQSKLDAYAAEMDGVTGRWSPGQQLYGHIFVGLKTASLASATTLGDANQDPHLTIIPEVGSPTPPWEWAAAWAAHATFHWQAPPELSRPLQTLILKNVLLPKDQLNWWSLTEQQALVNYGMSCWAPATNHNPMIMRTMTLRKDNAWGSPDPSWADAKTMFQAMYFARFMKAVITGQYPRAAFTTEPLNITGFASPLQIRITILQAYLFLQRQGLVENYDLFALALVVEKNEFNPDRCDVYMRIDVVNSLTIVAAAIETNLELSRATNAIARAEAA